MTKSNTQGSDEYRQFLIELSALSLKHGIEIGGCGCCGSPYLYQRELDVNGGYVCPAGDNEELTWIQPGMNGWDKLKSKICSSHS